METQNKQNAQCTSSTLITFAKDNRFVKACEKIIRAHKRAIQGGFYKKFNDDDE